MFRGEEEQSESHSKLPLRAFSMHRHCRTFTYVLAA
jgi:hypothetical protein